MKNTLILIILLFLNTSLLADSNISTINDINSIDIKAKAMKYKVEKKSVPEINVNLIQPINWYLILLPITTIIIVVIGFLLTKRQLEEKTKESINSFNKTIEKQTELSKNEIKLEVLSKNRQAWINTLREELSEFIGLICSINYSQIIIEGGTSIIPVEDTFEQIRNYSNKLEKVRYKINLMINPNENDNKIMIKLIETIRYKALKNENSDDDVNELVHISQIILKKEWDRVKELR